MISVNCSVCGKTLRVKEELAGRKGKCPNCGEAVAIPAVQRSAIADDAVAPSGPRAKINPKDILGLYDYSNYRNVRAVSRLFVFLGGLLLLSGIFCAFVPSADPQQPIHPAFAVGIAIVGLGGFVGGMATLRGNRQWAWAIKVMAVCYFFVFPIGTILSYVLLTGLPVYLDSMEVVRARREEA